MKIFGKHIFRSIKARPYQPMMITLIIAISVAVAISMFILPIAVYRESVAEYRVDEWTDDLTVTLKSNADVRLVFEEDIAAAVGERGCVLGEFSLNGIYSSTSDNGDIVLKGLSVAAVDLVRADSFYELRYTDYGKFTNTNIKKSAILSESYADACGISLGDSFTFTLLGREFAYTVQAIAMNTGIFNERDVLVDISGLREVLAERSPLIASLSNDFAPYTRVNIKLHDGENHTDVKEYLESLEDFTDKKVSLKIDAGDKDATPLFRTITIVLPGVLLLLVAVMLIVSSLDLLQKQRSADIALFKMVGADSSHLNAIAYLESVIYGIVGGIVGYIIVIPITKVLDNIYSFEHVDITCGITDAIFGVAFAVVFSVLCTAINIKKSRQNGQSVKIDLTEFCVDKKFITKEFVLIAFLIILGALAYIIPVHYSYIAAIAFIIAIVLFVYNSAPYFIAGIAFIIYKLLRSVRRGFGDLRLSSCSCKNSYPLKHAGRLMTVIISMFAALSFIIFAINDQYDAYIDFVKFDHIAVEVDDTTADMLRELEGVDALAYSKMDKNVIVNGSTYSTGISVSGDIEECFEQEYFPTRFPKGDEIALSRGVAKMIGASVGDEIECIIDDTLYILEVIEIIPGRVDFVFYDAEYVGVEYNTLCIRTNAYLESEEDVRALLDERGVGYLSGSEFFAEAYEMMNPQMTVISAMFYVMLFMTVLGIANVLSEQIMARSAEIAVLRQNGKTKAGVTSLLTKEIVLVLCCALIMSGVTALLLCVAADRAALTFGMSIFK